jgi:hypothetical protein
VCVCVCVCVCVLCFFIMCGGTRTDSSVSRVFVCVCVEVLGRIVGLRQIHHTNE